MSRSTVDERPPADVSRPKIGTIPQRRSGKAGLALKSFLGPVVSGTIDYRYTETFENRGLGLDAFALAIAAPLLVIAGLPSLLGSLAAPFLALGRALMAAYSCDEYCDGDQ